MTTNDLLKQGIAALNAGRKEEARRLLTQVVQQDERSEMGWLWLSGAVDTDEDRRACLENVLMINPNNGLAQRGLTTLQKRGSPGSGSTPGVTLPGEQAMLQPVEEGRASVTFQPIREETTTNDIFQQAVAAIKSGEKERGRQLLVEVLEQEEDNENAWLWMTRCVADRDVKRECFERVLAINPDNKHAIEGLKRLEVLSKAEVFPKRKKITKQQTRLVLGLGVAVLAIACIGIVSIWRAINSGLLPLGSAVPAAVGITPAPSLTSPPVAHQPELTVASPTTTTPVPTWTPEPLPTSIPTPDVKAEIEVYLDELDPLLDDMEEMWWEWHDWYNSLNGGKGMTSGWCLSYGYTLDTRYRELEAKHVEIVADIARLSPPRQLEHAHGKLVSAYRHKKEFHFLNFRGCAEHNFQLWDVAGIEDHYYAEEKQVAFDEIRDVLDRLDIEREDREDE